MSRTDPSAEGANLTGVPLFILMSLASGDKHGHSLMKDIERFAGVRLGPGTLYKAIARLESTGRIVALEPDERRRPYALTASGEEVLSQSLEYLADVVDEGRSRVRAHLSPSLRSRGSGVVESRVTP